MIAPVGRDSRRFFRVCFALLIVLGPTSANDLVHGSVKTASAASAASAAFVENGRANATTTVESVPEYERRGKFAETEFDGGKSTEQKGRKIGRASLPGDSYLEALSHSRTSTDPREGLVSTDAIGPSQRRKEYVPGPIYTGKDSDGATTHPRIVYGSPNRDSFSMVPSDSYTLPTRGSVDFGAFQNSYGPPRATYGPPGNGYPTASYDYSHSSLQQQQQQQQAYGPPAPVYDVPHGMSEAPSFALPSINFAWPFALKLNAFTLAKILLKLVIFKMIVKFIAVICLLLFIPKLEIKKKGNRPSMDDDNDDDDDDDEGRRSLNGEADPRFWKRLNELAAFASNAFEEYESLNNVGRSNENSVESGGSSRRRLLEETLYDYGSLLRSYALEEARSSRRRS